MSSKMRKKLTSWLAFFPAEEAVNVCVPDCHFSFEGFLNASFLIEMAII